MARFPRWLPVLATVLLAGCTSSSPEGADQDGDGLSDAEERAGWTIVLEKRAGNETIRVSPSVARPDSDGDGLSDLDEFHKGINPVEVDSDGDGLLDGRAMRVDPRSDLGLAFANWSLIRDPDSIDRWFGEADLCPETNGLAPGRWDSDRPFPDGIGDGDELLGWNVTIGGETRRVFSSPCMTDSDGDGMRDGAERERGTDPARKDSDDDGTWDFVDADPLRDLGLRATVESITLAETPPDGSSVRVRLNIAGREQVTERAASLGEVKMNAGLTQNVDDTTGPGSNAFPVQVVVRVSLVLANGTERPVDVSGIGRGDVLDPEYDPIRATWSFGDRANVLGALEAAGIDGAIRMTFARAEF